MIRFALLLFLIAGTLACKQKAKIEDIPPVDPRERMLGAYTVGYQARITIATAEGALESGTATLEVTKAIQGNELFLDFTFNTSTKERLVAQLTGGKFTVINKKTETIYALNRTFEGEYTGNGEFTDRNEFILVTSAQTNQNGTTIKRVGSITGTKK